LPLTTFIIRGYPIIQSPASRHKYAFNQQLNRKTRFTINKFGVPGFAHIAEFFAIIAPTLPQPVRPCQRRKQQRFTTLNERTSSNAVTIL
jgi:hypothetical protein